MTDPVKVTRPAGWLCLYPRLSSEGADGILLPWNSDWNVGSVAASICTAWARLGPCEPAHGVSEHAGPSSSPRLGRKLQAEQMDRTGQKQLETLAPREPLG